jgi:hypothetical protein
MVEEFRSFLCVFELIRDFFAYPEQMSRTILFDLRRRDPGDG